MVIAEISIFPLGTGSPSVGRYVEAAVEELEVYGLKCTLGPMGTTVAAETVEEVYAASARAQAAIFGLGAGRVYTVFKMDERRDVEEDRSARTWCIRSGRSTRTLPRRCRKDLPGGPLSRGLRAYG